MLWSLIMAGGSGTRFWPESRHHLPKQFLSIFGRKTLIEQTAQRIRPLIPSSRVLVITNQQHTGHVKRLLKISSQQIIGEPVGRNTAPCAVLAAALFLKKDPNAVVAILPSDHRIANEPRFRKALAAAAEVARKQGLPVTFGIKPSYANTGYGYLELQKGPGPFTKGARPLLRFHEKPDAAKAKRFVQSGRFLWNSGMFVWRADKLLEAAKKYLPKAYRIAYQILNCHPEPFGVCHPEPRRGEGSAFSKNRSFAEQARLRMTHYKNMPNISIDYGLMEKMAGHILTVPVDIGWHDLGGWLAFEEFWEKDADGNAVRGRAVLLDSRNNIVKSGKRLVAMIGVNDFVVVDTEDALLVCPKSKSEAIRHLVRALKKRKLEMYL